MLKFYLDTTAFLRLRKQGVLKSVVDAGLPVCRDARMRLYKDRLKPHNPVAAMCTSSASKDASKGA